MYTGIFPFKRDGEYWAAIDSLGNNIQRVLAFGSLQKLQDFLKRGTFQNGVLIDLRPYNLIQLDPNDAAFLRNEKPLLGSLRDRVSLGSTKKAYQPTILQDYPSELLDNIRGGEPLSGD